MPIDRAQPFLLDGKMVIVKIICGTITVAGIIFLVSAGIVIFLEIYFKINDMEEMLMKNQADLQAALDTLTAKVTGIGSQLTDFAVDFAAAIKALKDQIEAGGTDLEPQVTALTELSAKLDTMASALTDLDTTAEGISGTKTPPQ